MLSAVLDFVNSSEGTAFNSILVNYYKGHEFSLARHKDNEPNLVPTAPIATFSLGAVRFMKFSRSRTTPVHAFEQRLSSNSLFVMEAATQRDYFHEIAKGSSPEEMGPRFSVTFRVMKTTRGPPHRASMPNPVAHATSVHLPAFIFKYARHIGIFPNGHFQMEI